MRMNRLQVEATIRIGFTSILDRQGPTYINFKGEEKWSMVLTVRVPLPLGNLTRACHGVLVAGNVLWVLIE
jgi:hypothetical protein